jgi:hypothetical protein
VFKPLIQYFGTFEIVRNVDFREIGVEAIRIILDLPTSPQGDFEILKTLSHKNYRVSITESSYPLVLRLLRNADFEPRTRALGHIALATSPTPPPSLIETIWRDRWLLWLSLSSIRDRRLDISLLAILISYLRDGNLAGVKILIPILIELSPTMAGLSVSHRDYLDSDLYNIFSDSYQLDPTHRRKVVESFLFVYENLPSSRPAFVYVENTVDRRLNTRRILRIRSPEILKMLINTGYDFSQEVPLSLMSEFFLTKRLFSRRRRLHSPPRNLSRGRFQNRYQCPD